MYLTPSLRPEKSRASQAGRGASIAPPLTSLNGGAKAETYGVVVLSVKVSVLL